MQADPKSLGEILVERNVISNDILASLIAKEQTEGVPIARSLREMNLASDKDLLGAVAQQAGLPFVDLAARRPDPAATALLPASVAWACAAVPVDFEAGDLLVAMADPGDSDKVSQVSQAVGFPVLAALAERSEITTALEHLYHGEGASSTPSRSTSDAAAVGQGGMGAGGSMRTTVDFEPQGDLHLNELLAKLLDMGGSDLHLSAHAPPTIRIDGELLPLADYEPLTGNDIRRMIFAVLTQRQRERFEADLELDASHSVPGMGRFRVNVMMQRDSVGAVLRAIPFEVVPIEKLGMPPAVGGFADLPRGLVLVTGPTGSGKSTTLAALVDQINQAKPVHIMTVEDPIEFLHHHKRALVNQREIGEDTHSFAEALRHVLRQDPDVILVGEMRDLETIGTALTAAETGHLVFGTLHTQDAPQSIDRIIDVFPSGQQGQIRVQLASALQGIVTQQLIPRAEGKGRAVAAEVLVATPAIRNLIREGKTHQVYSAMQAGGQYGMQTMDMALAALVRKKQITMQAAIARSADVEDLRRLAQGG